MSEFILWLQSSRRPRDDVKGHRDIFGRCLKGAGNKPDDELTIVGGLGQVDVTLVIDGIDEFQVQIIQAAVFARRYITE